MLHRIPEWDEPLDLGGAHEYSEFLMEISRNAETAEEREHLQAEMRKLARRIAFDSPARLAEAVDPNWMSAPHLELISDTIKRSLHERVATIITVPVRHGKSELISAHAPAWYLEHRPDHRVIALVAQSGSGRGVGPAQSRSDRREPRAVLAEHPQGLTSDPGMADDHGRAHVERRRPGFDHR